MAMTTTCKGCARELNGETEDELVFAVQQHVAEAHAGSHTPSREQVLQVIRSRGDASA